MSPRADLLDIFLAELDGHVVSLQRGLPELRRELEPRARDERFRTLLRATHSLKGAARSVGRSELEAFCHGMEELLVRASGQARVDGTVVEALLEAVESLRGAGRDLRAGSELDERTLARGRQAIEAALEPLATASRRAHLELVAPRREDATADRTAHHSRSADAPASARLEVRAAPPDPATTAVDRAGPAAEATFALACEGLELLAADLGAAVGKPVVLEIRGGDVSLDRRLAVALRDPLRHLVRNGIDHGIEARGERLAAGKAADGRISVEARADGADLEVIVADDGRGLDAAAIRESLLVRGLPVPETEAELARAVFLPGLSTAPMVTGISGRGIGLDVVRAGVEQLGGSVALTAEPGRGARFALRLPRGGVEVDVLIVRAGGRAHALLASDVRRVAAVELPAAGPAAATLRHDGRALEVEPLVDDRRRRSAGRRRPPARVVPVVVVATPGGPVARAVDGLIGRQKATVRTGIVVAGGAAAHGDAAPAGGAAVALDDGAIAGLLLARDLTPRSAAVLDDRAEPAAGARRPRSRVARVMWLLPEPAVGPPACLVDDLDAALAAALEDAGHRVVTDRASSALDAWRLMTEHGADLVVAAGPRGAALVEAIRGSGTFHDLPVILLVPRARLRLGASGADVLLELEDLVAEDLGLVAAELLARV